MISIARIAVIASVAAAAGMGAHRGASAQVRSLVVDGRAHAVEIDSFSPATMALDGASTYRLSVAGVASYGGYGFSVSQVFFHCGNSFRGPSSVNWIQGVVRPGGTVEVSQCRRIWAFVVDNGSGDNSGTIALRIRDPRGTTRTLSVDARRNALEITGTGAPSVRLDGASRYRLSVSDRASLGGYGFTVSQVFFHCANSFTGRADANTIQGVVRPDETVFLRNCTTLWAFLVDNGTRDNQGKVRLHVEQEPAQGAGPRGSSVSPTPVGFWTGTHTEDRRLEPLMAIFCSNGRFGLDDDPCAPAEQIRANKWGTWTSDGRLAGSKIVKKSGFDTWFIRAGQLHITNGRIVFQLSRSSNAACPLVSCDAAP